jgi:hypothetical protein
MNVVWKGQHDRHGTPDAAAPMLASLAEAAAALHAALLVHWFRTGVFRAAR